MALTDLTTGSYELRTVVNSIIDRVDWETTSENSAAADTGALSVAVCNSYVTLDGTDARTLAAPTFAGQTKRVYVVAGSNTPVLALTVTGMRVGTADVYTSGTWTGTNAPLALHFRSSNGTTWDPPIMTGTWTIS